MGVGHKVFFFRREDARPVRMSCEGSFEDVIREVDLDARRFEYAALPMLAPPNEERSR